MGITSGKEIGKPFIQPPIFGTVLPRWSVLTFGLSCTNDVILVQRGQQMSITSVVSNIGSFRKWVNVLTMPFRSPFMLKPLVLFFFGMLCREYKLFFDLMSFIDITSSPCLEMRTGP